MANKRKIHAISGSFPKRCIASSKKQKQKKQGREYSKLYILYLFFKCGRKICHTERPGLVSEITPYCALKPRRNPIIFTWGKYTLAFHLHLQTVVETFEIIRKTKYSFPEGVRSYSLLHVVNDNGYFYSWKLRWKQDALTCRFVRRLMLDDGW